MAVPIITTKWYLLLLLLLLLLIELLLTFWAGFLQRKYSPSPYFQILGRDQATVKDLGLGLSQALTFLVLVTLNKLLPNSQL